ncbi:type II toxin-antitoxin system VapC family toxin [Salinarimonas sp. NSM]|uniref:type II toxin-antitoxin system VapC family toxin n=1 Tax=Salinarimonas sp. NSM TaxID=3458003 RepID=UPI0040367F6D
MSTFDLDRALRRLRRRGGTRARRPDVELAFLRPGIEAGPLLLDTCVYVDQMRGVVPDEMKDLLRGGRLHHSTVAMQELLHAIGALDPADPRSSKAIEAIRARLEDFDSHRLHVPDADILGRAALLAGVVCRVQGYARDGRLRALHDCVLFVQALKHGLTVITANVGDFDVLAQLEPRGRVLFYRRA